MSNTNDEAVVYLFVWLVMITLIVDFIPHMNINFITLGIYHYSRTLQYKFNSSSDQACVAITHNSKQFFTMKLMKK